MTWISRRQVLLPTPDHHRLQRSFSPHRGQLKLACLGGSDESIGVFSGRPLNSPDRTFFPSIESWRPAGLNKFS
jgi:hypothetical protein